MKSAPKKKPCPKDCPCLCHDVNGGPVHFRERCSPETIDGPADWVGDAMSTPRETVEAVLYLAGVPLRRDVAGHIFDSLELAGFEVLPTALVDAVLTNPLDDGNHWDAMNALRAYREQVTP